VKEHTEWHTVVLFGRQAEIAGEYLRKGAQVFVEGRLRTRKWQDKSGAERYSTEILGSDMQMLGSASGTSGNARGSSNRQSTGLSPADEYGGASGSSFEDDIPFNREAA